jgi:hypothetical protein
MVAKEYNVIVPSACSASGPAGEQCRTTEYNFNYINFTYLRFGLNKQNTATSPGPDRCATI